MNYQDWLIQANIVCNDKYYRLAMRDCSLASRLYSVGCTPEEGAELFHRNWIKEANKTIETLKYKWFIKD